AGTLKDLALALLVGILVGTYSSIFVATPFLTILKESEPRYRNVRERVLRDAKRAEGRAQAPAARAVETDGEAEAGAEPVAATVGARARSGGRPPQRRTSEPRAGSKKAK